MSIRPAALAWGGSMATAMLLVVAWLGGCREHPPRSEPRESAVEVMPVPVAAAGSSFEPHGSMDLTFFVTADTHFGASVLMPGNTRLNPEPSARRMALSEVHERVVAAMNGRPGRAYPTAIGGQVAPPRGVLIAGDLTEGGRPDEWQQFLRAYGGSSDDGGVRWPVFEVIGNHDGGGAVKQAVCGRHGGCPYSFRWDDLVLIALSDGPDEDGLAFLRRELARNDRRLQVVLYFHFPLIGPFSTGQWFGDGDYRKRLRETIAGHPIAAIFHGHFHGSAHYRWAGHDVYNVGSVKHGQRSFAVVRVTDTQLAVSSFNLEGGHWWWWHAKPLAAPDGSTGPAEIAGVDPGPGGRQPYRYRSN